MVYGHLTCTFSSGQIIKIHTHTHMHTHTHTSLMWQWQYNTEQTVYTKLEVWRGFTTTVNAASTLTRSSPGPVPQLRYQPDTAGGFAKILPVQVSHRCDTYDTHLISVGQWGHHGFKNQIKQIKIKKGQNSSVWLIGLKPTFPQASGGFCLSNNPHSSWNRQHLSCETSRW